MGSGASKKGTEKNASSNFDEDEDEDFDTYSKKKVAQNSRQPKLEQANLLPKLTSPSKKNNNGRKTIVGLEDDDESDIEEISRSVVHKKKGKKEEERELRNEIIELEKTFENLDLEGSFRHQPRRNVGRGLYRSSTLDDGYSSFNDRPHRGNARPPVAFGTPAISKPLKFSWQETKTPPVVDKDNDDWNYQQTVIDGFDPDKFRKANKESNKHENGYDSGIRVERQFGSASSTESYSGRAAAHGGSRFATTNALSMPGVPSYDNSEKQLLATLEQELGVL